MKLNDLIQNYKIVAFGFPAIKDLVKYDNKEADETVVISTLSPSLLVSHGVNEYYALDLPKGEAFNNGLDIIKANINVYKYRLTELEIYPQEMKNNFVIVSRHKATIESLKNKFDFLQNTEVLHRVKSDDIKGKHVFGTLPHKLVCECDSYTAVTIKNYNYGKDKDLLGDELQDRIYIAENPIMLEMIE